jgi:hypothetical protein
MTVTATFTDLGEDRTQVDIEQTNVPEHFLDPQLRRASSPPSIASPPTWPG